MIDPTDRPGRTLPQRTLFAKWYDWRFELGNLTVALNARLINIMILVYEVLRLR